MKHFSNLNLETKGGRGAATKQGTMIPFYSEKYDLTTVIGMKYHAHETLPMTILEKSYKPDPLPMVICMRSGYPENLPMVIRTKSGSPEKLPTVVCTKSGSPEALSRAIRGYSFSES